MVYELCELWVRYELEVMGCELSLACYEKQQQQQQKSQSSINTYVISTQVSAGILFAGAQAWLYYRRKQPAKSLATPPLRKLE